MKFIVALLRPPLECREKIWAVCRNDFLQGKEILKVPRAANRNTARIQVIQCLQEVSKDADVFAVGVEVAVKAKRQVDVRVCVGEFEAHPKIRRHIHSCRLNTALWPDLAARVRRFYSNTPLMKASGSKGVRSSGFSPSPANKMGRPSSR